MTTQEEVFTVMTTQEQVFAVMTTQEEVFTIMTDSLTDQNCEAMSDIKTIKLHGETCVVLLNQSESDRIKTFPIIE